MNPSHPIEDGSHLFQVEIRVSAPNRGAALKHLLQVLSQADIADYRIGASGQHEDAAPQPAPARKAVSKEANPPNESPLELRIRFFIETSKLIRITVNKGRGIKLSLPCRVLSYDIEKQLMTVYHVDEKQVYTVGLNEIDDFVE
ncbi:hypothetical protein ACF3MZ_03085 [Paenibacillaceae bacterium WGS1546]|uniref:hypothetical protein n=1 Tax=Cohnella sp. WGS1546 TaxID=3366810 RepID=UPI00372CF016